MRIGVATVPSTARTAPARCAISATATMSTTCNIGLEGVSIQTIAGAAAPTTAAIRSGSVPAKRWSAISRRAQNLSSQSMVPKYRLSWTATAPPGGTVRNRAAMAAMPEGNTSASAPRSRVASRASNCR